MKLYIKLNIILYLSFFTGKFIKATYKQVVIANQKVLAQQVINFFSKAINNQALIKVPGFPNLAIWKSNHPDNKDESLSALSIQREKLSIKEMYFVWLYTMQRKQNKAIYLDCNRDEFPFLTKQLLNVTETPIFEHNDTGHIECTNKPNLNNQNKLFAQKASVADQMDKESAMEISRKNFNNNFKRYYGNTMLGLESAHLNYSESGYDF